MNRKTEMATQYIEEIAEDDSHGYSQSNRWGEPDYDCSSLVISVWQRAGVPVKSLGATYTGNMYLPFIQAGFKDITPKVNRTTGEGLERGDVLLNSAYHSAMYVGDGKIAHARSSEGNTIPGDGNGREIVTGQNYFNYPWDYFLRYEGDEYETSYVFIQQDKPTEMPKADDGTTPDFEPPETAYMCVQYGDGLNVKGGLPRVKAVQALLCENGHRVDIDGEFGRNTERAVKAFATERGLDNQSGIVDEAVWKELIKVYV